MLPSTQTEAIGAEEMPMKFVILQTQNGEMPILFPDTLFHDQVEEAFDHDGVISAGFISFAEGKLSCDGESESLGIQARGEDDEITIVHKMLS
jgi:hypothetical protein